MEDKRELELVNSFKEYLEILIKDFSDIEYDKIHGKNRHGDGRTVRFYRAFISQLVSRLKDIASKITVADILRFSTTDEFNCHDPVIIPMKDRFQQVKVGNNLQNFRNRPLELGNRYVANLSGYVDDYTIDIFNRSMTSPEIRIWNGKILDYRLVRRLVSENEPMQIEHEITIYNPIANLKYIKEYNEIAAEVSNSDDEPSDVDVEMVKVDAPVTLRGNDGDKVKTTYSVLKKELEFKNSFQEYLNILIEDFERVDLDNPYKLYTVELAAYNKFCKDFIKNLVKLLTALRTSATVVDILGPFKLKELPDDLPVIITLKDKFKKLPIPSNIANFHNKSLEIGNHYRIDVKGNSDDHRIIICNPPMTSPKVRNPDSEILCYRIVKHWDTEDNMYFKHEIIISNPIANLNFIKSYVANLGLIKRYEASGDEYVEEPVELDEEYVESDEDDELMEDCDDTTVSESENTETNPSDNTANVNISLTEGNKGITLPGPNGSKISINLSINISFN